jgi:F-type H+-transporting ATPase subunit delta
MKQRQYSPIERTYAEALLGAARRLGVVQRAQEEARVLLKVATDNPRLLVFLESPHIATHDKLALLDRVFQGRLGPLMMNLLHVLAGRRRTTYLNETLERFQELVERSEGILRARVTTARELNFQDKLRLKAALERFTRAQLKIEYLVEERLIGGLICRLRDTQIDTSLRSGLEEIRRRLMGTTLTAGG